MSEKQKLCPHGYPLARIGKTVDGENPFPKCYDCDYRPGLICKWWEQEIYGEESK